MSKKVWNSRCGHVKKSGIPAPSIGGKAGIPGGQELKNSLEIQYPL